MPAYRFLHFSNTFAYGTRRTKGAKIVRNALKHAAFHELKKDTVSRSHFIVGLRAQATSVKLNKMYLVMYNFGHCLIFF